MGFRIGILVVSVDFRTLQANFDSQRGDFYFPDLKDDLDEQALEARLSRQAAAVAAMDALGGQTSASFHHEGDGSIPWFEASDQTQELCSVAFVPGRTIYLNDALGQDPWVCEAAWQALAEAHGDVICTWQYDSAGHYRFAHFARGQACRTWDVAGAEVSSGGPERAFDNALPQHAGDRISALVDRAINLDAEARESVRCFAFQPPFD